MAVSITQRPADWSPVNNPVVYKFTTTVGPFTNYRIEVEVFAGGVSVGAIFSFTPNSSNVTTADISAILKSILYREWSLPVGVNESEDGIGSTEFYIKYQELYTGSATSQVSDSSNPKIGVLAALQIGSNADLDLYVPEDSTKKFLTKFDIPKLWSNYPFTISFLYPLELIENTYAVSAPSAWADGPNAFGTKNATHFIKNAMAAGTSYQANFTPLAVSIPTGYKPKFAMNVNAVITAGDTITIQVLINNGGSILSFDFVNISTTSTLDYELDNFQEIVGLVGNKITISASSSLGGSNVDITINPSESLTASFVTDVITLKTVEYDQENIEITTTFSDLLPTEKSLNRLNITGLNALSKKLYISLVSQIALGAANYWTDITTPFGSKTSTDFIKTGMSSFPTSYSAYRIIDVVSGSGDPNNFNISITVANLSAGSVVVLFSLINSVTTHTIWDGLTSSVTTNGTFSRTITWSRSLPDEDIDTLKITASKLGGGTAPNITITIATSDIVFSNYPITEIKTIQVESACKNPVYLVWKNSLGGDAEQMFYFGQEDYFTYENGRKAKRQVLYAENLSYNEWETINELNTPGDRYQVPIVELTSSLNKTGKRTDQQVYVVDTDGSKVGVIVIPRSTSARTDKKIHSISIEIEYPTIFL